MWTKIWRSGTGWHSQLVAQAIAEAGVSIAYVAPLAQPEDREPSHPLLHRVLIPRELVGSASKSRRIAASLSRMAKGTLAVFRLRGYTHTFLLTIPEPLPLALLVISVLRLSGARIIFQVHDAEPHAWRLPSSLRWLERQGHGWCYGLSNHLVCLTAATRDVLVERFGQPAAKITVIPHGPFELTKVTPLPGNRRLLIFGSLRRNKNVLTVIEGVVLARRQGHAVTLMLAGEPMGEEPGYWEECLAAAGKDTAGFDIQMGFVPEGDIPAMIAESDAFVLAYDNFNSQSGVGVLAAMAGRPVIGTGAGGLDDLYEAGMAGPRIQGAVTSESVAAAIATFCCSPTDYCQAAASKAVERVREAISWAAVGAAYAKVIRSR